MKLENEFTVPVPVPVAWDVLQDVERIAPCVPGATLTGSEDETYTGSVKVKVGPIKMTYRGRARIVTLDEDARYAVIEASGKDTRGGGTAAATVTTTLTDTGGTTLVRVETDLTITGRVAQFGRGVLSEVAGNLIDQFAACLADELAGSNDPPSKDPAESTASRPLVEQPLPRHEPEAIDLLEITKGPIVKRIAVAGALGFVLLVIWRALRRSR